ncbi:hypothetical protein CPB84DRAFT_1776988 [Gymnopilus junonius]|uniref:Uncharacterized protein n=1 Tax=Gymnopilus junonius TaxID=109634 RepID=A0A9P5NM46_GYMJU|nr:hypothetical protein CPB84DRAFT_1776988 [Gymnopilus junonius]
MNTFSATLYNSLPSVDIAHVSFSKRDEILSKLATVFNRAEYRKFGVCLVHRHCILEEGERMVARGNISQPERVYDSECYPERWLVTGEAYEFTQEPTTEPPVQLVEEFRKIVGNTQVLGLFFIHNSDISGVALERTEGRKNIIEIVPRHTPRRAVTTAWLPAQLDSEASVKLYECSICKTANNSHIENVAKMEGLERRRDLGHEIGWLAGDIGGLDVRAV